MNGRAAPDRLATLAELPAGRMVGKPLYVLISNGTASAAEEFTGHVGGYRIGELIGETTRGRRLPQRSGADRRRFRAERLGRPRGARLDRARLGSGRPRADRAAPTSPGRSTSPMRSPCAGSPLWRAAGPERARLEAIAEGVAARGERRTPALPLAAYAGSYGERPILAEGGRLYLPPRQRARASP